MAKPLNEFAHAKQFLMMDIPYDDMACEIVSDLMAIGMDNTMRKFPLCELFRLKYLVSVNDKRLAKRELLNRGYEKWECDDNDFVVQTFISFAAGRLRDLYLPKSVPVDPYMWMPQFTTRLSIHGVRDGSIDIAGAYSDLTWDSDGNVDINAPLCAMS